MAYVWVVVYQENQQGGNWQWALWLSETRDPPSPKVVRSSLYCLFSPLTVTVNPFFTWIREYNSYISKTSFTKWKQVMSQPIKYYFAPVSGTRKWRSARGGQNPRAGKTTQSRHSRSCFTDLLKYNERLWKAVGGPKRAPVVLILTVSHTQ